MLQVIRFFLLITVLTMGCSFKAQNKDPIVKRGNVIYSFASGKMQCQSEIDSNGHIFVLLKSLDKNTNITFSDVIQTRNSKSKKPEFVVKALMTVAENSDICAGWINAQEVSIKIDPLPVQSISLSGKQVYVSDHITVMIL
ncbi:MAG: hypothetical protein AB7F64_07460 [Gammaproteobacteria bacterium]